PARVPGGGPRSRRRAATGHGDDLALRVTEHVRSPLPRRLLRRLGLALLTLLLVSILVFATAELLPGDLGRTILGPYGSEEQVAERNDELGEDDPAPVRYVSWLSDFVSGDWGTSAALQQPVRPLVLDRPRNLPLPP